MTTNDTADHIDRTSPTQSLQAGAFLVEWQQGGMTWMQAHADEPTAVDQVRRTGGTCTPLFRAEAADTIARLRAENERMRRVIRPFAHWYDINDCEGREGNVEVPVSSLRAAAAVLATLSSKEQNDDPE